MMRPKNLPSKKQFAVNYIGGAGYYAFHLSWILVIYSLLRQMLQYVIVETAYVEQSPPVVSYEATAPGDDLGSIVRGIIWVVTIALSFALIAFVALLPYFIGLFSRGVPRIIIKQTNYSLTSRSLFWTKQLLVSVLFVVALMAFARPGVSAEGNIEFLTISIGCVVAWSCFGVQYKLATLWKIPERHIV